MNLKIKAFQFLVLVLSLSCVENEKPKEADDENQVLDSLPTPHLVADFEPIFENGEINVAIEIPAGTLEKWEVNKGSGRPELEIIDGKPRIIKYLGYPGNYGMIPRTLLPKEKGGDGDPLDVLVIGSPIERGAVVRCRLIGVLHLMDSGELDDKLIAVMPDSPFYSIKDLAENRTGLTEIIELWFSNYKGSDKMISYGFEDEDVAQETLNASIEAYQIAYSEAIN